MRKSILISLLLGACLMFSPSKNYSQRPTPPGLREAAKKINAPTEPPVKLERKPVEPAIMRQEAEELAKLSAAIPAQVDQVAHDQISKELANQLKRIEKLAKQLRSQLSP